MAAVVLATVLFDVVVLSHCLCNAWVVAVVVAVVIRFKSPFFPAFS